MSCVFAQPMTLSQGDGFWNIENIENIDKYQCEKKKKI